MLRPFIGLKLFLILNFLKYITGKGSYTINAPGTIYSNQRYTVSATLHNVSEPGTLRIGLRKQFYWSNIQMVTLQAFETKMLDFFPPKLESGKYELFAESVKGVEFYKSREIEAAGVNEGIKIYIETDKGAYKPGEILKYRVILLDRHARPMNIIEPIKVQIFDAEKHRIKQIKDIRLNKGFYADELQLSKYPISGIWSIKVSVGGKYAQEHSVKFEVTKYILPKFKTYIETDESFVDEDRFIKIDVFGRYTYKRYVEGKVMLTIEQLNGKTRDLYSSEQDIVDFKARFQIDFNDFSNSIESEKIIVTATLIEKQTNISEFATKSIYIRNQRYNIIVPLNEIKLRNDEPYSIKAIVQHWNGSRVNEPGTKVLMQHGTKSYETSLDLNGEAIFEYVYSEKDDYRFRYKNSQETKHNFISHASVLRSAEHTKCTLELTTKFPKLNSPLNILLKSDENIPYFVYIVTGHSNIIRNEIVQLSSNKNSHTIQLMPIMEMMPISYLYVHYIVNDELVFCETKIELPEELENKLSITSPKKVKPGENVTLTINAQPGSIVAIAAADLSTILYHERNTINLQELFKQMRYDVSYVSGKSPGQISGLVTLTDLRVYHEDKHLRTYHEVVKPHEGTNKNDVHKFQDNLQVRTHFPESWIFSHYEISSSETKLTFQIPDSITTWYLTALTLNAKTGLGVLDQPLEITAFQQFFINTYLPYSIKLGEIVAIPIVVFNYYREGLEVEEIGLKTEVIMENQLGQFKFVDSLSNTTTNSLMEKQVITLQANSGTNLMFLIKPIKLGYIDISLRAKKEDLNDAILQKLLVEPDGLANSNNQELFITLKSGEELKVCLEAKIDENVVPDTEFLQLSISGNVLMPSLENIEDLVDKPTGCGEQNMIHFAPNILVLEYLGATRQTLKYANLVAKAKKYTEIGYQQQLKFLHRNGGYSVFGRGTPSNWLTAYVVRFFIKAVKYLPIETPIIESSLNFLAHEQLSSGEFRSAGYLFHSSHQSRYGFTAFVLLAFLENSRYAKKHKLVVQKALDFLSNNISEVKDIYSLAIMATAFQMAQHNKASEVLEIIKPRAKHENGLQWWEDDGTNDHTTNIEITSYILMALLHKPGQYGDIVKWLLEQRNKNGGFKSTQDTVVGLQALIKFAQVTVPQNDTLIKVRYRALNTQNQEVETGILGLDSENIKTLQYQQLPPSTRSMSIELSGTGNIFIQFSYQYRKSLEQRRVNSNNAHVTPKSFILKAKADLEDNSLTLDLELCITYTPLSDVKLSKTNMIIAEINLPSGYIVNTNTIDDLINGEFVDRIENEQPNKISLYFEYIEANEEKCINIQADKKDDVRDLKPSTIVVYDYYSERREVVIYEIGK